MGFSIPYSCTIRNSHIVSSNSHGTEWEKKRLGVVDHYADLFREQSFCYRFFPMFLTRRAWCKQRQTHESNEIGLHGAQPIYEHREANRQSMRPEDTQGAKRDKFRALTPRLTYSEVRGLGVELIQWAPSSPWRLREFEGLRHRPGTRLTRDIATPYGFA